MIEGFFAITQFRKPIIYLLIYTFTCIVYLSIFRLTWLISICNGFFPNRMELSKKCAYYIPKRAPGFVWNIKINRYLYKDIVASATDHH